MGYKTVVDTNVIVSYMMRRAKKTAVVDFMNMVLDGELSSVVSQEVMEEYREILCREKFGFSQDDVKELLDFFRQNAIMTETWDTGVELPDSDDLPFFEAYVAEQSPETFLVTGNQKHYPEWPYIVTPRQMVDYLGTRG